MAQYYVMAGLDLAALILVAPLSYCVSEVVMRVEMKLGFTALDVHKPSKKVVARSGGVALILSFTMASAIWSAFGRASPPVLVYVSSIVLAGLIGLLDDLLSISVKVKLILFCAPALLPIAFGLYEPHPYIPGVGQLRLTILYPLAVAAAYSILANAFNMSDTHNGLIVLSSLVFLTTIYASTLLPGPRPLRGFEDLLILSTLVLLGYAPLNMYPARMLNGNAGSHMLGALVAALAISSRRELLAAMALAPQILNGYLILFTAGLKSKEVIERPTKVMEGGLIAPNCSPSSPITLVKLFVVEKRLTERELIIRYASLQLLVSAISLLLYFIMNCVT